MARMPRTRPGTPAIARPEVLTIDDLAQYFQLFKSSLYGLVQSGNGPARTFGRPRQFHRGTIDEWLKAVRVASTPCALQ